jgi:hypothetical protein
MKVKILKVKGITVGIELTSENAEEKSLCGVIYERQEFWTSTAISNGQPDAIRLLLGIPNAVLDED